MLESLYLRDFVIVEQAEIEFSAGFCALSGETGAGKSILLDALGLALGNRADPSMVRAGAAQTEISAAFSPSRPVRDWLRTHELANVDDDLELRLRRLVLADGRSKAFINGSPVTVGQLRELGEQLIEIHGQHASQSLLNPEGQRRLLDDFARAGELCTSVQAAWTRWRDARRLLEQAASRQHELAAERDDLKWRLDDIEALAPGEDEWQSLGIEQTRLAHGAELIATTQAAAAALAEDDDSLSDRLRGHVARLRQQVRHDPTLNEVLEMLESAQIQLVEAASTLSAYGDRIDVDPARHAEVESRISAMFALARKLRCDPEELPAKAREISERLATLQSARDIAGLEQQVAGMAEAYDAAARELGTRRREAADMLSNAVDRQLNGLGMSSARFEIVVGTGEPGPQGTDRIEFLFAGHESLGSRALNRVASGGELSRVSLAIAVSAAQANPVDSLIFDEADAGVGGAVADAIGRMMRELGDARQVLAVTHLPQVAARAHRHFRISRESGPNSITSRVDRLDDAARVEEIARMLGGAQVTATTREHAAELLEHGSRLQPVKPASKARLKQPPKVVPKDARKTTQKIASKGTPKSAATAGRVRQAVARPGPGPAPAPGAAAKKARTTTASRKRA